MNKSILKSSRIKTQLICGGLALLGLAAPLAAHATYSCSLPSSCWFSVAAAPPVPIDNTWRCPFPAVASDWVNYSPFDWTVDVAQRTLHWDNGVPKNSSGIRIEVPNMRRASDPNASYAVSLGDKAVIQAIYAIELNKGPHTDSWATPDLAGAENGVPYNVDAAMINIISRVNAATKINDGGMGTPAQLMAGLNAVGGYHTIGCQTNTYLGTQTGFSLTTPFEPNIDIATFTNMLFDGLVAIVWTSKFTWNASQRAWAAGVDGLYIIKSVSRNAAGVTTYQLSDVATGNLKTVTPGNLTTKVFYSDGSISGAKTMTFLDDGRTDYGEFIVGITAKDPMTNPITGK